MDDHSLMATGYNPGTLLFFPKWLLVTSMFIPKKIMGPKWLEPVATCRESTVLSCQQNQRCFVDPLLWASSG